MDYQALYDQKKVDVEEALSHIKSGDVLATSLCAMEPVALFDQLHTIAPRVENVRILTALVMGNYPFMQDAAYADKFTIESGFVMGMERKAHRAQQLNVLPGHLHNISARWAETHHPNVFLGCVSQMDEHGFCRFSLSNFHELDLLSKCDLVICQVNPNMPVVGGETEIHISQIDYLVEAYTEIPQLQPGINSEMEDTIGQYVASLVHDGDTIQLGIGGIPDASAKALMEKHDLGIHTEMITNSMADLIEAGVVTNRKKNFFKGKTVGTFALGNARLYRLLHNNPSVCIMRGSFVNDPSVIAHNDNMVSINTAIEVDLSGQVFSETLGTLQYSGSGGQNDTAEGAIHSKGGRSIIALHSTAKKGTVSTINAVATPGAVVTLSRNNVDYIVTEYGIAPMRGRSVRERVDNLIAIAHPDFRAQLRQDAQRLLLW